MSIPTSTGEWLAALHRDARARTGLDDFGDASYEVALGALVESYLADAELSPVGEAAIHDQLVGALVSRLRSEEGFRVHGRDGPASRRRPIFIVGLPRTGTSALHQILCRDPEVQGLDLWLAESPRPRPPRTQWESDPEFQAQKDAVAFIYEVRPELRAIHFMSADRPDECWRLFRQDFASVTFECTSWLPGYSAWWADCDMRAAYRRHRDLMGLIGGDDARRWVLKDPSHLFALDALLDVHPDALIVQTHRDPVKLIPSVCSLNAGFGKHLWRAFDPARLGRAQLELWGRGLDRFREVRRRQGDASFMDVPFEDFVADPVGVAVRIMERAGGTPGENGRAEMVAWHRAHPKAEHGRHEYAAEDFGLSAGEIAERFADYSRAFDVRPETEGGA